ncbi:MAG: histone [Herminiimonas sp.]|nr:histone [Herminiimonas sp.]
MTTYIELQAQIKALQQKAEQLRKDEMPATIAAIIGKMQEHGITIADLRGAGRVKAVRKMGTPVAPKYRDPTTNKTWSGRGKEPKWLVGRDRKKFLIT